MLLILRRWAALSCIAFAIVASMGEAVAQGYQTATPLSVELRMATPQGSGQFAPTVTVAPSLTPPGAAMLEARESAGRVNVRALPDPNSEILGSIASGTRYPALRKYYLWLELRYEPSPSGRAWVFGELVDISGDVASLVVIEDFAEVNSPVAAVEAAPADPSPQDDEARTLIIATLPEPGASAFDRSTPLPTYTYPPSIRGLSPTEAAMSPAGADNNSTPFTLPPLAPIALLAGLGLAGLLISGLRQI